MDYGVGSQYIIYTNSMSHIAVGRLGNVIPPCSGLWEARNDMLMWSTVNSPTFLSQTKPMICVESIRNCQQSF